MPEVRWAERDTLYKYKDYQEREYQMFGIQFDAAGIYLVGTPTHQFHISFEELMSTTGGIIGLLEYGLTWKVIYAILSRFRHRLWHDSRTSLEAPSPIWIDNSGPASYEVRHGLASIRVSPQELESSRFGRTMKKYWDRGMSDPSTKWIVKMVMEALFIGIWKGLLRKLRVRRF